MNLVCTSCIKAAEDEPWSAGTGGEPADLCMSLGAQMDAHDCLAGASPSPCACAYPHDGGLEGNDAIRVLQLGQKYGLNHGFGPIGAEGMRRAINRALVLLLGRAVDGNLSSEELLATYYDLNAKKEPNTNNLVGLRCPKCGSYEPFFIAFEATYTVYDQGHPQGQNDYGWTLDSDIVCTACRHRGIVGEFLTSPTVGESANLKGTEEKGHTTSCTNFSRDFGMRTTEGNEAVGRFVCCVLEAMENGRRGYEVISLIGQSLTVIYGQHPEITSVTVRDYIFNALSVAYRKNYGVRLPYSALVIDKEARS